MGSVLLYIHGFNSSPLATKSQQLATWCALHRPDIQFISPALPPYPKQAMYILQSIVEQFESDDRLGLVGSSLGGYWATWLNQHYGCNTVLVNPAVAPYKLLLGYLGHQQNPYTGESYFLTEQHIKELQALEVSNVLVPEKIWLLQQQGDEVLDYRQAVKKYQHCKQMIEPQGNHAFVGFERFCEDIVQFLAL